MTPSPQEVWLRALCAAIQGHLAMCASVEAQAGFEKAMKEAGNPTAIHRVLIASYIADAALDAFTKKFPPEPHGTCICEKSLTCAVNHPPGTVCDYDKRNCPVHHY